MTNRHHPASHTFMQPLLLSITISLLTACSGGGGEASLGNEDNDGGSSGKLYVTMQAKSGSWTGPFSEEMQVASTKTSAIVTWEEPTRSIDGACLDSDIDTYIAHIGKASGQYDTTVTVLKTTDTKLSCSTGSKTDTQCGKTIQNCTYTLDIPPQ